MKRLFFVLILMIALNGMLMGQYSPDVTIEADVTFVANAAGIDIDLGILQLPDDGEITFTITNNEVTASVEIWIWNFGTSEGNNADPDDWFYWIDESPVTPITLLPTQTHNIRLGYKFETDTPFPPATEDGIKATQANFAVREVGNPGNQHIFMNNVKAIVFEEYFTLMTSGNNPVPVGDTFTRSVWGSNLPNNIDFILTNIYPGDDDLTVNITITQSDAEFTLEVRDSADVVTPVSAGNYEIAEGESYTIRLIFDPDTPLVYQDYIVELDLELTFIGIEPAPENAFEKNVEITASLDRMFVTTTPTSFGENYENYEPWTYREFTIENISGVARTLNITPTAGTTDNYALVSVVVGNITLTGPDYILGIGDEATVRVEFRPTTSGSNPRAGSYDVALATAINGYTGEQNVQVTGTAIPWPITFNASTINDNFEEVRINTSETTGDSFVITGTANANVTFTLGTQAPANAFTVTASQQIPTGGSLQPDITFTPVSPGTTYTAPLTISMATTPPFARTVNLTGLGVPHFIQVAGEDYNAGVIAFGNHYESEFPIEKTFTIQNMYNETLDIELLIGNVGVTQDYTIKSVTINNVTTTGTEFELPAGFTATIVISFDAGNDSSFHNVNLTVTALRQGTPAVAPKEPQRTVISLEGGLTPPPFTASDESIAWTGQDRFVLDVSELKKETLTLTNPANTALPIEITFHADAAGNIPLSPTDYRRELFGFYSEWIAEDDNGNEVLDFDNLEIPASVTMPQPATGELDIEIVFEPRRGLTPGTFTTPGTYRFYLKISPIGSDYYTMVEVVAVVEFPPLPPAVIELDDRYEERYIYINENFIHITFEWEWPGDAGDPIMDDHYVHSLRFEMMPPTAAGDWTHPSVYRSDPIFDVFTDYNDNVDFYEVFDYNWLYGSTYSYRVITTNRTGSRNSVTRSFTTIDEPAYIAIHDVLDPDSVLVEDSPGYYTLEIDTAYEGAPSSATFEIFNPSITQSRRIFIDITGDDAEYFTIAYESDQLIFPDDSRNDSEEISLPAQATLIVTVTHHAGPVEFPEAGLLVNVHNQTLDLLASMNITFDTRASDPMFEIPTIVNNDGMMYQLHLNEFGFVSNYAQVTEVPNQGANGGTINYHQMKFNVTTHASEFGAREVVLSWLDGTTLSTTVGIFRINNTDNITGDGADVWRTITFHPEEPGIYEAVLVLEIEDENVEYIEIKAIAYEQPFTLHPLAFTAQEPLDFGFHEVSENENAYISETFQVQNLLNETIRLTFAPVTNTTDYMTFWQVDTQITPVPPTLQVPANATRTIQVRVNIGAARPTIDNFYVTRVRNLAINEYIPELRSTVTTAGQVFTTTNAAQGVTLVRPTSADPNDHLFRSGNLPVFTWTRNASGGLPTELIFAIYSHDPQDNDPLTGEFDPAIHTVFTTPLYANAQRYHLNTPGVLDWDTQYWWDVFVWNEENGYIGTTTVKNFVGALNVDLQTFKVMMPPDTIITTIPDAQNFRLTGWGMTGPSGTTPTPIPLVSFDLVQNTGHPVWIDFEFVDTDEDIFDFENQNPNNEGYYVLNPDATFNLEFNPDIIADFSTTMIITQVLTQIVDGINTFAIEPIEYTHHSDVVSINAQGIAHVLSFNIDRDSEDPTLFVYDFGLVRENDYRDYVLEITNDTDGWIGIPVIDLTATNHISFEHIGTTPPTPNNGYWEIAAGQTFSIRVIFNPTATGEFTRAWEINEMELHVPNTRYQQQFELQFKGEVQGPLFTLDSSDIDTAPNFVLGVTGRDDGGIEYYALVIESNEDVAPNPLRLYLDLLNNEDGFFGLYRENNGEYLPLPSYIHFPNDDDYTVYVGFKPDYATSSVGEHDLSISIRHRLSQNQLDAGWERYEYIYNATLEVELPQLPPAITMGNPLINATNVEIYPEFTWTAAGTANTTVVDAIGIQYRVLGSGDSFQNLRVLTVDNVHEYTVDPAVSTDPNDPPYDLRTMIGYQHSGMALDYNTEYEYRLQMVNLRGTRTSDERAFTTINEPQVLIFNYDPDATPPITGGGMSINALNFENTLYGYSTDRYFVIANPSDTESRLISFTMPVPSHNDLFTFELDGNVTHLRTPLILPAGESWVVKMTFTPDRDDIPQTSTVVNINSLDGTAPPTAPIVTFSSTQSRFVVSDLTPETPIIRYQSEDSSVTDRTFTVTNPHADLTLNVDIMGDAFEVTTSIQPNNDGSFTITSASSLTFTLTLEDDTVGEHSVDFLFTEVYTGETRTPWIAQKTVTGTILPDFLFTDAEDNKIEFGPRSIVDIPDGISKDLIITNTHNVPINFRFVFDTNVTHHYRVRRLNTSVTPNIWENVTQPITNFTGPELFKVYFDEDTPEGVWNTTLTVRYTVPNPNPTGMPIRNFDIPLAITGEVVWVDRPNTFFTYEKPVSPTHDGIGLLPTFTWDYDGGTTHVVFKLYEEPGIHVDNLIYEEELEMSAKSYRIIPSNFIGEYDGEISLSPGKQYWWVVELWRDNVSVYNGGPGASFTTRTETQNAFITGTPEATWWPATTINEDEDNEEYFAMTATSGFSLVNVWSEEVLPEFYFERAVAMDPEVHVNIEGYLSQYEITSGNRPLVGIHEFPAVGDDLPLAVKFAPTISSEGLTYGENDQFNDGLYVILTLTYNLDPENDIDQVQRHLIQGFSKAVPLAATLLYIDEDDLFPIETEDIVNTLTPTFHWTLDNRCIARDYVMFEYTEMWGNNVTRQAIIKLPNGNANPNATTWTFNSLDFDYDSPSVLQFGREYSWRIVTARTIVGDDDILTWSEPKTFTVTDIFATNLYDPLNHIEFPRTVLSSNTSHTYDFTIYNYSGASLPLQFAVTGSHQIMYTFWQILPNGELSQIPPNHTATILANNNMDIRVIYLPTTMGDHTMTFVIQHNATPSLLTIPVTIKGTAIDAPTEPPPVAVATAPVGTGQPRNPTLQWTIGPNSTLEYISDRIESIRVTIYNASNTEIHRETLPHTARSLVLTDDIFPLAYNTAYSFRVWTINNVNIGDPEPSNRLSFTTKAEPAQWFTPPVAAIDFPDTFTGSQSTQNFTIVNERNQTIIIDIENTGIGFFYTVVSGATVHPQGGFNIIANATATFRATFNPPLPGAYTGNIEIKLNDATTNFDPGDSLQITNIALTGNGRMPTEDIITVNPDEIIMPLLSIKENHTGWDTDGEDEFAITNNSHVAIDVAITRGGQHTQYAWSLVPLTGTTLGVLPNTLTIQPGQTRIVHFKINDNSPAGTYNAFIALDFNVPPGSGLLPWTPENQHLKPRFDVSARVINAPTAPPGAITIITPLPQAQDQERNQGITWSIAPVNGGDVQYMRLLFYTHTGNANHIDSGRLAPIVLDPFINETGWTPEDDDFFFYNEHVTFRVAIWNDFFVYSTPTDPSNYSQIDPRDIVYSNFTEFTVKLQEVFAYYIDQTSDVKITAHEFETIEVQDTDTAGFVIRNLTTSARTMQNLNIVNVGTDDILDNNTNPALSNYTPFILVPPTSLNLGAVGSAGMNRAFTVQFKPIVAGEYTAELRIKVPHVVGSPQHSVNVTDLFFEQRILLTATATDAIEYPLPEFITNQFVITHTTVQLDWEIAEIEDLELKKFHLFLQRWDIVDEEWVYMTPTATLQDYPHIIQHPWNEKIEVGNREIFRWNVTGLNADREYRFRLLTYYNHPISGDEHLIRDEDGDPLYVDVVVSTSKIEPPMFVFVNPLDFDEEVDNPEKLIYPITLIQTLPGAGWTTREFAIRNDREDIVDGKMDFYFNYELITDDAAVKNPLSHDVYQFHYYDEERPLPESNRWVKINRQGNVSAPGTPFHYEIPEADFLRIRVTFSPHDPTNHEGALDAMLTLWSRFDDGPPVVDFIEEIALLGGRGINDGGPPDTFVLNQPDHDAQNVPVKPHFIWNAEWINNEWEGDRLKNITDLELVIYREGVSIFEDPFWLPLDIWQIDFADEDAPELNLLYDTVYTWTIRAHRFEHVSSPTVRTFTTESLDVFFISSLDDNFWNTYYFYTDPDLGTVYTDDITKQDLMFGRDVNTIQSIPTQNHMVFYDAEGIEVSYTATMTVRIENTFGIDVSVIVDIDGDNPDMFGIEYDDNVYEAGKDFIIPIEKDKFVEIEVIYAPKNAPINSPTLPDHKAELVVSRHVTSTPTPGYVPFTRIVNMEGYAKPKFIYAGVSQNPPGLRSSVNRPSDNAKTFYEIHLDWDGISNAHASYQYLRGWAIYRKDGNGPMVQADSLMFVNQGQANANTARRYTFYLLDVDTDYNFEVRGIFMYANDPSKTVQSDWESNRIGDLPHEIVNPAPIYVFVEPGVPNPVLVNDHIVRDFGVTTQLPDDHPIFDYDEEDDEYFWLDMRQNFTKKPDPNIQPPLPDVVLVEPEYRQTFVIKNESSLTPFTTVEFTVALDDDDEEIWSDHYTILRWDPTVVQGQARGWVNAMDVGSFNIPRQTTPTPTQGIDEFEFVVVYHPSTSSSGRHNATIAINHYPDKADNPQVTLYREVEITGISVRENMGELTLVHAPTLIYPNHNTDWDVVRIPLKPTFEWSLHADVLDGTIELTDYILRVFDPEVSTVEPIYEANLDTWYGDFDGTKETHEFDPDNMVITGTQLTPDTEYFWHIELRNNFTRSYVISQNHTFWTVHPATFEFTDNTDSFNPVDEILFDEEIENIDEVITQWFRIRNPGAVRRDVAIHLTGDDVFTLTSISGNPPTVTNPADTVPGIRRQIPAGGYISVRVDFIPEYMVEYTGNLLITHVNVWTQSGTAPNFTYAPVAASAPSVPAYFLNVPITGYGYIDLPEIEIINPITIAGTPLHPVRPVFEWEAEINPSVEGYIIRIYDGNQVVYTSSLIDAEDMEYELPVTFVLDFDTDYKWDIRYVVAAPPPPANNTEATDVGMATANFTTLPIPKPLILVSPEEDAVVTTLRPLFTWSIDPTCPSADAIHGFKVFVEGTTPPLESVLIGKNLREYRFPEGTLLDYDEDYTWIVVPMIEIMGATEPEVEKAHDPEPEDYSPFSTMPTPTNISLVPADGFDFEKVAVQSAALEDLAIVSNMAMTAANQVTLTVQLKNASGDYANNNTIFSLRNPGAGENLNNPATERILTVGNNMLDVRFGPLAAVEYEGQIIVSYTMAPANEHKPVELTLELLGEGVELPVGDLIVQHPLGNKFVITNTTSGTPVLREYTVTNDWDYPVTITGMSITGATDEFEIVPPTSGRTESRSSVSRNDITLAPGEATSVIVQFFSQVLSDDPYEAELVIDYTINTDFVLPPTYPNKPPKIYELEGWVVEYTFHAPILNLQGLPTATSQQIWWTVPVNPLGEEIVGFEIYANGALFSQADVVLNWNDVTERWEFNMTGLNPGTQYNVYAIAIYMHPDMGEHLIFNSEWSNIVSFFTDPRFTIDPLGLIVDFGQVVIDELATGSFTITNSSDTAPLNINVAFEGDSTRFQFAGGNILGSRVIEPSGTLAVPITFNPNAEGIYEATFTIQTTTGILQITDVKLIGEGIEFIDPDTIFLVSPNTLNFGARYIETEHTMSFTITDYTGDGIEVELDIIGPQAAAFSFDIDSYEIDGSAVVEVTFAPLVYGNYYATVVVTHADSPFFRHVTLEGQGLPIGPPPTAPNLVTPAANAQSVPVDTDFVWSHAQAGPTRTAYHFYISDLENVWGDYEVLLPTATTFSLDFDLDLNKDYWWRVDAVNENGFSSAIRSFKTVGSLPPNPVSLMFPPNLATFVSLETDFTWEEGTLPIGPHDSVYFYIWVANTPRPVQGYNVIDENTFNIMDVVGTALAAGTTYNWEVIPYNENTPAENNQTFSFTTESNVFTASPVSINWGELEEGTSEVRPLTIQNLLDTQISVEFEVVGPVGVFTVAQSMSRGAAETRNANRDARVTITVPAGGTNTVNVTFAPPAATTYSGSLTVKHDREVLPGFAEQFEISVPLIGTGTAGLDPLVPPSQPFAATLEIQNVILTWNAPQPLYPSLVGYNVYRVTSGSAILLTPQPIGATSYMAQNQLVGSHEFRVTAVYQHGESAWLALPVDIDDITTPPRNVSHTLGGENAPNAHRFVTLTWEVPIHPGPGTTLQGYRVYRGYEEVTNPQAPPLTELTFTDRGAENQGVPYGTYTYNVRAVYAGGLSNPASDLVHVEQLLPVRNLEHALDNSHVILTWLPPEPKGLTLLYYEIHRGAGVHNPIGETSSGDVLTFVAQYQPFGEHTFRVAAVYKGGMSPFEDRLVPIDPLNPPAGLRVTGQSDREVRFEWDRADAGRTFEGYVIFRNGVQVAMTPDANPDILTFTDTAPYGVHSYSIAARYFGGDAVAEEDAIEVRIAERNPPRDFKAEQPEQTLNALLSWERPLDTHEAVRHFNLYKDNEPAIEIPSHHPNYTYVGLDAGFYTFFITAVYSNGESARQMAEIRIEPLSEGPGDLIPLVTELVGNFPNPFNPDTTIRFDMAEAGNVSIEIFNVRGQRIRTLANTHYEAGTHDVVWNGRDDNGREVGSGMYLYIMRTEGYHDVRRMTLMK